MTTQQNISDRVVKRSVKEAITKIHSDPIWGYVEATINAFTAMRHLPADKRIVYIWLPNHKRPNNADIIAEGTGFTNYDYIEKNMGYDPESPEYIASQKDPDYLNKMGIGIPTIASLSKDGIAEFHSVSLNSKGQEEGLVATYTVANRNDGWILPAEHPDSKYVFGAQGLKIDSTIKTGVWVHIRNAKYYQPDKVYRLLSKTFARKLGAGYRIMLRSATDEHFTQVLAPENFCQEHERLLGYIHDDRLKADFPVYADIHQSERANDTEIRVLMKKLTIDSYGSDYQAKGYFGCDALEFKPDREGLIIDANDLKFQRAQELLIGEFVRQGIQKKPTPEMKDEKRANRWKEKAKEMFLRYYTKHRGDSLLQIEAMAKTSPVTGESRPSGNSQVTLPNRRCPNGYHWDNKSKQCLPTSDSISRSPATDVLKPRGPSKAHFGTKKGKRGRKRRLNSEYTEQSIPNFRAREASNESKFLIWIDEKDSTIYFNMFYPWMKDVYENANESTMELLYSIAMMEAVPDNCQLGIENWLAKLAKTV